MTTQELRALKAKLKALSSVIEDIDGDIENMRSYFKYQSEDTDTASEDAIVAWQDFDVNLIQHISELVDEIIEWNER